ncbi:hypothetical protein KC345_g11934, partial [Hortaea werneckii]
MTVLLTACGNNNSSNAANNGAAATTAPTTAAEATTAPAETAAPAAEKTVTDAMGHEVIVPANPQRVLASYLEDYLGDTVLNKIKPNGKYTKVDTGGAVIEFFTPENGVKFTMKTGVSFFDLEEGIYGPGMAYDIEPKAVKSTDKVEMTMQVDSINQKLNPKLDAILAKIIKPGMTEQQK